MSAKAQHPRSPGSQGTRPRQRRTPTCGYRSWLTVGFAVWHAQALARAPGRCVRQVTRHMNGTIAGSPRSGRRGSNVTPKSLIQSAGCHDGLVLVLEHEGVAFVCDTTASMSELATFSSAMGVFGFDGAGPVAARGVGDGALHSGPAIGHRCSSLRCRRLQASDALRWAGQRCLPWDR